MKEQCNTCRFWLEDMSNRDPNDPDWGFGHCRRSAPKVIDCMVQVHLPNLRYGQQSDPDIDTVSMTTCSMWPATSSVDWCGEFQHPPHRDPANLPIC